MTTTQSLSGSPSPSQSVRPSKKFSDGKTQDSIGPTVELRIGWMPQDPAVVNRWLSKKIEQAGEKDEPFAEVIQKFQKFIENDASILILFQQMFNQVPTTPPYDKDTWGNPSVRDYKTMLRLFNSLLTEAPIFTSKHASLAFPINAILQWPMGTPAGKALFQIPSVNEQFCNV
ncbi:C2 domain-containing protein C31G5.15, partial [Termitomyces sp. T112]